MEIKGNHTLNGGSGARMDAVLDRGNLTTSQSLLWMGQKLHPETPLYNMAVAFRIGGPIDPQRFRNAWHRYADSCDALRLAVVEENGVPLQRPRDTAPSLEIIDLSNLDDPDNACSLLMAQRCRKVFDLATDLTDSALIKLADDRWVWYLNQHHLVTDGWSSSIVYRGVEKAYREPDSDVHTQPFDDYAKFERKHRQSRLFEKALRYWNERASDIPPPITFYGRQPTGAGTRTDRVRRRLGVERSESLKGLAERMSRNALSQHVGRFNLLMSVLAAYLFRVSGQTRLNIGAPAHNRPTAAFKQTAGVFIEVLPFRVDVEEEDTLRSLFEKVSHETSNFLRHAHPGSSQARLTRSFNVVLNYINVTIPPFAGYSVETEWIHCDHGDSSHHLRVQVHDFDDTGEFVLGFDFSREVFDETEQQEAATHFIHLIDELVRDPDRRIAEASLLDEDERSRMINVANGPAKDVPRQTVCELFIHEVADNPNRVLLMDGDRSLTSEQVLRAARTVAADLCEAGVGIGDRVGLYMTRSADLVVGMLGVMFAGAAYVPVDPADPPARSEFVFKDADVGSILVSDIGSGRVPIDNRNIVVVDPLADSDHDGGELPRPRELAYIIYTSGSTGRPKGVAVSHGALASYVKWAASQYASDRSPLVFPFFTSPSFDMTITSLFVPLLTGGSIVIFRPEGEGPDISLRSVLADERVNTIKLTPTHLSLVQDMRVPADRVRQLIFGGENLRRDTAEAARTVFGPEVVIYNEYGPTEATVGCIVHKYDEHKDHETSVPIGRPISGSRAYLLDKGLNPIPQGTIGELFLGGPGLAEGYWDRDDITAERFIPDPFRPGERMYRTGDLARIRPDGSLVYLGRDDDQIKLHGFRVERGEVEAALTDHPDVVECAVVLTGTSRHDLQTQYCSRCGLSSEYPQTTFDEEGVCNTCRSFDGYRDRAMEFFSSMDELQQLLESESKRKTGKYDCLALFSGGKDSTYTLCRLVEMGRSVLAFTLDNGFISEKAKENIDRLVAHLGVDHVYGTTPAMNQIFAESLKRHANVCNGCFKTIYTLAMKTAHDHGIPVIVTGLSRGQLFETRLTGELFVGESVDVDAIEETILHARKAYHRLDDEVARLIDFEEARGDEIFRQIKFVDFYRYCDVGLDEVMSFLESRVPWVRPDDTGRSTNCLINEAGIFVHQKERGYHNYAWPYAWDVRMGHKTRTDVLDELQDDIDVSRVQQMLDQVGYSVDSLHATRERLTAYYAAPYSIAVSELRDHLRQRLPEFMIPTAFVRLDEVPRSPSGKIDLKALPQPDEARPSMSTAFVEPRSDEERILCRVWREVLRIDRVGVRDNFFDLGGDSIMAIQIVARATREGLRVSPSQLFHHQTIEALASESVFSGASRESDSNAEPIRSTPLVDLDARQLANVTEQLKMADERGEDDS